MGILVGAAALVFLLITAPLWIGAVGFILGLALRFLVWIVIAGLILVGGVYAFGADGFANLVISLLAGGAVIGGAIWIGTVAGRAKSDPSKPNVPETLRLQLESLRGLPPWMLWTAAGIFVLLALGSTNPS